jgi:Uncharacterised nucleotidyltransferase
MKPGMECVLHVLRGESIRPDITCSEWHNAFHVAEQEKVMPFFATRLRQCSAALPESIQEDLSRAEREIALSSFWWTSELRGILQAFAAESIPVIPLKGPMLAKRIYGGTNLRVSSDLDLLIRPAEIDAAGSVLKMLGFVAEPRPNDYEYSWRRGTTLIELHFDVENPLVFNFDIAAAWTRARRIDFLGQPVWQFAPSDELLFVCLHGVRHCFERLSHVLDIVCALNCLAPEIDPKFYKSGNAARLRPMIALGRAMAMHLDPRCNPAPEIQVPPKTAAHLEKLADRQWTAMLEAPSPCFKGRKHRLYMETEVTVRGRLLRAATFLYYLATRLTNFDFDFAAGYGVHKPALVWIVRQLRLLAELCGISIATE